MREHAGVVRIPPAYPPQQPRILPGIDLRWQGPQLFEKPQVDAEGIMPDNDSFKTLHIIRPLGPHKDRSSVWLCSTSDSQDRPVDVVLKIFSAALHAKPDLRAYADNNLEPEQLWRWSPGPEPSMFREAMVYMRLKEMQGNQIPRSYGFYRFTFPESTLLEDSVIGHVSEYVAGRSLHEVVWDLAHEEEAGKAQIHEILKAVFEMYEKIHAEGVAHQDIGCRNMCMLTEAYSLKPTRIVVFDFEFAQFGRNTYGIFSEELATLNEFLLDLGAWKSGDIVTDWIENGEGKLLYQNFGASLLTPEGLKRRTEELVQEEQSRHEDSEADKAWREMYDAQ